MMKRFSLLFSVVMMVFLLCSCGHIEITCEVTAHHEAMMEMRVEVPTTDLDSSDRGWISSTLPKLKNYWKSKGLEAEVSQHDDGFILVGSLRERASGSEEAFEKLLTFMTHEVSPFSAVEGGYSPSYFSDKQYLKAAIDISNLVDMDIVEGLPPSQQQRIMDALGAITGTVRFRLPSSLIDKEGTYEGDEVYTDLALDKPTVISMVTEIKNTENVQEYGALNTAVATQKKDMVTYGAVLGGLIILLILSIILLVIAVKRSRGSKAKHMQSSGLPPVVPAMDDTVQSAPGGIEDRGSELERLYDERKDADDRIR